MTVIFWDVPARSTPGGYNIGHLYNHPHLGNILRNPYARLTLHKMFHCDTCDTSTNNKYDFNRHLLSPKHQRLCSENVKCKNYFHSLISGDSGVSGGEGAKSIPPKSTLKKTDVSTPQKTPIKNIVQIDLHNEDAENNVIYLPPSMEDASGEGGGEVGHVTTAIADATESHVTGHVTAAVAAPPAPSACKYCKRPYINRTGLWRHNKRYGSACIVKMMESSKLENTEELKNMINTMIDMNQAFKTQILDLYKTNAAAAAANDAMVVNPTTTVINNTNNNNMTNCYNQTFNVQFFLNEQCKDAMNMKDFVNSIQLNTDDLESVGKLGYVEGMSNILINNLNKTELHKRPVHCSDIKRETLYVKDEDKWEKDGPDHAKMTNAVLAVEHKNVRLIGEWAAQHPRCMDSNSNDNVKYFKLSKTITDGAQDGNISKVIRRVAKNVMIDKSAVVAASATMGAKV